MKLKKKRGVGILSTLLDAPASENRKNIHVGFTQNSFGFIVTVPVLL